jgi:hypothetical protein
MAEISCLALGTPAPEYPGEPGRHMQNRLSMLRANYALSGIKNGKAGKSPKKRAANCCDLPPERFSAP